MRYQLKNEELTELTDEFCTKLEICETYNEKEEMYKQLQFIALNHSITTDDLEKLIKDIYELNNLEKNSDDPVILFHNLSQEPDYIFILLEDLIEMSRVRSLDRAELINFLHKKTNDFKFLLDERLSNDELKTIVKSYIYTCEDAIKTL
jgi:hypothetical protein